MRRLNLYIHSIKIINYKSVGTQKNELILEPKITAIIGKNESGKSNIIEALSKINLLGFNKEAFTSQTNNKDVAVNDMAFQITLKPQYNEKDDNYINKMDSIIIIDPQSYKATGGILFYYNNNCGKKIKELMEILGENPFKLTDQSLENYKKFINALISNKYLDIPTINQGLSVYKGKLNTIDKSKIDDVTKIYNELEMLWNKLINFLPTIFYTDINKTLKDVYNYDDAKRELTTSTSNSLLFDIVKLLDISVEDFLQAIKNGHDGNKIAIRNKIKKKLNKIINTDFKQFYNAESIYLDVDFNNNNAIFTVKSNEGNALLLSERSNGLRWYLNTYINAKANNLIGKNVVYLFDEPGIYLHINAQKELLKFFYNLSENGNQIVYTTHSPYMIDTDNDGIYRIRAIEKNNDGFTYIHKTAYDSELSIKCREDTLAPIINAIGMNFGSMFGPSQGKLNIVTEGISDYIYLHTMAKLLKYDMDSIAFIPSQGASNIINICTILYGWGCDFMALFDYDNEGVVKGGKVFEEKFGGFFENNYCYTKEITKDELNNKTYIENPFTIEDVLTKSELDRFENENNISKDISKALLAKLLCNAINNKTYNVGDECKDNFKKLLSRIIRK